MSRKFLLDEPAESELINIGSLIELTGGDSFYTKKLDGYSNTAFKELTGGDGFYTRTDNDAYSLDFFSQWKDIGPLFPMEFKGGVGVHYKDVRDRSMPSLSAIKGKRIHCVNDKEEFPGVATKNNKNGDVQR